MGARSSAESNQAQCKRANRPGRSVGAANHPAKHPLRRVPRANADLRGDAAAHRARGPEQVEQGATAPCRSSNKGCAMKQKWGRPDDAGDFPSDKAVWTIGAFCVALLSVFAIAGYRYMRVWRPLQRHYLLTYAGTPVAGAFRIDAPYTLLMVVTRKGTRMALDNEVEPFVTEKGESTFTLTEEAIKVGDLKLEWQRARYDNVKLHEFLGHWIYQGQTLTDLAKPALWGGLGVLLVGLVVAIPKDAARRRIRKHGRRLKGPELVTARAFNRRNRSDGIGFSQQQSFKQKIFRNKTWLRLPREIESSHILVMGDSGKGKSALIRQILLQIEERGETAIVYDPATPADYVPYFLTPSRGDLILNPLDQRMPYWTPGDELRQGADALTLAASLFPDPTQRKLLLRGGPAKNLCALAQFPSDAARVGVVDVAPGRDRPESERDRVRGDDRPGFAATAQRRAWFAEHGSRRHEAAAERSGDKAALEHARMVEGAARLAVSHQHAGHPEAPRTARQFMAGHARAAPGGSGTPGSASGVVP